MYRKAILCGLPITEANISDGACHPEDRIRPNFFSDLSQLTWRDLKPTDVVHYTVALHQIQSDEPCRDVIAGGPIETDVDERERIAAQPTATT
jgi:hypothetical protein